MNNVSKELLERAKSLLLSDGPEEEELIYLGYLVNKYIDNPSMRLKIHLTDLCFFIEGNMNKTKTR